MQLTVIVAGDVIPGVQHRDDHFIKLIKVKPAFILDIDHPKGDFMFLLLGPVD